MNIDDNIVYIVHVRIKSKAQTFGTPVERSFQTNNLSRNLITKRSSHEFCLARNNILCVSPSVWIACSNKMQSLKTPSNGLSTNPSVYHHLLNHAQCLRSVGLIKEQNCVDVLVLIFTSHVFRLPNFLFNVFVCSAAMHLVMEENCQRLLVNMKKTRLKLIKTVKGLGPRKNDCSSIPEIEFSSPTIEESWVKRK